MLNFRYIKVEPTTFLMQFKNGQLRRKGLGLSFWYYLPNTSLVAIPVGSTDIPFMFKESTQDFQEVTVQGQVVFRISDPEQLSSLMNYTLKKDGSSYTSSDPDKLHNRLVNLVQVAMQQELGEKNLREAIISSQQLAQSIHSQLTESTVIKSLGLEIIDLAILAIKPTPDMARALEAVVREELLEEADEALYKRRNSSIEYERSVKENELKTELTIEQKQQQIREEKLKAERSLQEQKRQIQQEKLEADISLEERRQALVALATGNARQESDAKAYDVSATMEAISKVDVNVLEALTTANLTPQQLLAHSFKLLANSSEKIGQLNISPDLLQALSHEMDTRTSKGKR